jgi:hypothetical protein
MTKSKTKIALLKEHLKSGKTITQLEAIGLYSLFRLAARVHELKAKGWNIITTEKRDANGSVYAEYSLGEPHFFPLPSRYAPKTDAPITLARDYSRD